MNHLTIMTEEFSLLQALLQEGNYPVVIDLILQNLPDLEDLQNLCLVNHTCYNYFRAYVQGKTNYLRQSWLNSKHPYEFRHLSFAVGWSVQCFQTQDLDRPIFVQSLYQVDKEDFPWTQFIGNCSLSKRFLVITPTTAEHEIHLWRRLKFAGLSSSHMTIKQQMADRYANLHFEYFIILYRHSLYTLFNAEQSHLKSVWDYNVHSGEYAERIIVKVVVADKFGILHWEKDILEKNSINLRSYKNKMILKTYLNYINKGDNLKINDIIGCTKDLVIIDMSDKFGNGHLDLYNYRTGGEPLKRFDHPHKPQHGWVVHCRSVAPPVLIPSLSLVPFIQYSLCLDLELLQISQKNPDDLERPWPVHVESVAYNRSQIFFTDFQNRNLINVISTK